MVELPLGEATNLFTGGTLLLLAASLPFMDRRRSGTSLLAAFLAVVGLNFVLIGWAQHTASDAVNRLAFAALAVDPLLLVGAVTVHPYRRRPPRARALVGVLGSMALVSGVLIVLAPQAFAYGLGGEDLQHPARLFLLAGLGIGYIGAWVLVLDALGHAPTSALARRSVWFAGAVGIAVVPRLALLPIDVGLARSALVPSVQPPGTASVVFDMTVYAAIVVAMLAVGAWRLRDAATASGRRMLGVVAGVSGLFAMGQALAGLGAFQATLGDLVSVLYALRWPVFAVVLFGGVATQDVIVLQRAAARFVPVLGAVIGALAGLLYTLTMLTTTGDTSDGVAWALAAAVAMGASVPAGVLARAGVNRLERRTGGSLATAQRLELYRAALEAAWRGGRPGPDARAGLERERRRLAVSMDEARALEHVVARGGGEGPVPGDEPVAGLVLGNRLGEGAQGAVFEAWDHVAGRKVVVKLVHGGGDGSGARRRLTRELKPLQRLDHEGIVNLLDVHATADRHLLVLEPVPGQPLSHVLEQEGVMDPGRVVDMGRQVLDALAAAHDAGVVHRDIKPSNVLVTPRGRVVLTDFGLARPLRSADETASHEAAGGLPAGTPAYMAPEQARGHNATVVTDLYQVGLVLYEALTGHPALDVRGYSYVDALTVAAEARIDLTPVPDRWRTFLERALAIDLDERYPSARAMAAALPDLKAGTPAGSAPP